LQRGGNKRSKVNVTLGAKLADLFGTDDNGNRLRHWSKRWQVMAQVPEDVRQAYYRRCRVGTTTTGHIVSPDIMSERWVADASPQRVRHSALSFVAPA
jgi:hypothetical protein